MTGSIILHPIEEIGSGGLRLGATLKIHGSLKKWHQYIEIEGPLPGGFEPVHTGDVWATYFIFKMMEFGGEFSIEGDMSFSLVTNLDRFVEAWCCWKPELFRYVRLYPHHVIDDSEVKINPNSLACFSGGLDACFTLYRHRKGLAGPQNLNIKACLFVHGADIRIDHDDEFQQSLTPCRDLINDLGVTQLFVVRANFREMRCPYGTAFLSLLAACMRAVGRDYGSFVVGGDSSFDLYLHPWGSNPVSNQFLASNGKLVITDGLRFGRSSKAALVAKWPLALKKLRVCSSDMKPGGNCGKCSKCKRTYMNFFVAGVSNFSFLPPINEKIDISDVDMSGAWEPFFAQDILKYANAHGRSELDWVVKLRSRLAEVKQTQALSRKKKRGIVGKIIRHFEKRRIRRNG